MASLKGERRKKEWKCDSPMPVAKGEGGAVHCDFRHLQKEKEKRKGVAHLLLIILGG